MQSVSIRPANSTRRHMSTPPVTLVRRAGSGYVGRGSNPEDVTNPNTLSEIAQRVGSAAMASAFSSLAVAFAANADVGVKLGSDAGGLVFEPATVEIAKGESVVWTNNAGFPHNIVFDEDAIPAGENAEKLSREDYLNAPGEQFKMKFNTPGTYEYYCEPHQGAGMKGKVIVK